MYRAQTCDWSCTTVTFHWRNNCLDVNGPLMLSRSEHVMKSWALSVCWWGGGRGERSHSPRSSTTISLMQLHSSICDVIQRLFIIIIIITWALKQHTSHLVGSRNPRHIFPHFSLWRDIIKPEAERGFSLRSACVSYVRSSKSGYSSRPVTVPQDNMCGNTMMHLDLLQEELSSRPVFLLPLNHSYNRSLFVYYPVLLTCHFHVTLPMYAWAWEAYHCSQSV